MRDRAAQGAPNDERAELLRKGNRPKRGTANQTLPRSVDAAVHRATLRP